MISKRVQILEILYPKGIKKEQYTKIDKIFGLIDHLIDETKETNIQISKPIKDIPVKSITMSEAMDELEEPPEPSKPIDYFPVFVELDEKEAPFFKSITTQRIDYDNYHVLRDKRCYKLINPRQASIISSLDYLHEYYDKMPEKFSMKDIEGINRNKQSLLFNFYLDSSKFKNKCEIVNNTKYIVKDI